MIFERAEKFPPCICRMLARKGQKPMSAAELSERSGLSPSFINSLSRKRTWKGVGIDVVQAFSMACGVDLMRTKSASRYIRNGKMPHIHRGNAMQRKMFHKMFTQSE